MSVSDEKNLAHNQTHHWKAASAAISRLKVNNITIKETIEGTKTYFNIRDIIAQSYGLSIGITNTKDY